jgi:protein-histidine pros-kinase
VAEDNVVNQRVVLRSLERAGYRVDVVADGEQAVAAFESHAYDLILMDVQMPRLDGWEAAARIRASERGARVPIVALTAHAMAGDRERCLQAGMDDYLSKPVQLARLHEVMARWLTARAEPPLAYHSG